MYCATCVMSDTGCISLNQLQTNQFHIWTITATAFMHSKKYKILILATQWDIPSAYELSALSLYKTWGIRRRRLLFRSNENTNRHSNSCNGRPTELGKTPEQSSGAWVLLQTALSDNIALAQIENLRDRTAQHKCSVAESQDTCLKEIFT